MSETAAVAADTASPVLTLGSLSSSVLLPVGSSTSTRPNQKAMRMRKNIAHTRPVQRIPDCGFGPAFVDDVARADKSAVQLISANCSCGFTENFLYCDRPR